MTTADIVKLQEMYQAKAPEDTIKLLRDLLGLRRED